MQEKRLPGRLVFGQYDGRSISGQILDTLKCVVNPTSLFQPPDIETAPPLSDSIAIFEGQWPGKQYLRCPEAGRENHAQRKKA